VLRVHVVSDPDHPRYGQHLTTNEVNDLIKPTEETSRLVRDWLADYGIHGDQLSYSATGDWIKFDISVREAEELLGTSYSTYQHNADGSLMIRTPEWSLPRNLHAHISTIQPTNSFMRATPKRSTLKIPTNAKFSTADLNPVPLPNGATVAQACSGSLVTPDCLRTLYGTINYTPQATNQTFMALCDYLGEVNIRSDATIYLNKYRPDAVAAASAFQQVSIAGGTVQQKLNSSQIQAQTGIEGNLDVQTMLGIAWPVPLTAYSTGGSNPDFIPDEATPTNSDEPYLEWVQYMLSLSSLPSIVSTSYGDDEQTVSPSYASAVCNAFAQLGAKGVTLLFSSGDSGVGSSGDCVSNTGSNAATFLPAFPAGCPYVTTVGGTYKTNPEVAALDGSFTSGGGFSNYFPRPSYQDSQVSAYLSANSNFGQYADQFNASGRAYPDIAAQSVSFGTAWNGAIHAVDGTSAASPTAAGVLALVNDALIAAGKSPLGFLNPWLYKTGSSAFTDILSGSSAGCGGNGFPAAKGWDAVTGFGTPVCSQKLLEKLSIADLSI
jgi:tripeptidyl-peptidase-1